MRWEIPHTTAGTNAALCYDCLDAVCAVAAGALAGEIAKPPKSTTSFDGDEEVTCIASPRGANSYGGEMADAIAAAISSASKLEKIPKTAHGLRRLETIIAGAIALVPGYGTRETVTDSTAAMWRARGKVVPVEVPDDAKLFATRWRPRCSLLHANSDHAEVVVGLETTSGVWRWRTGAGVEVSAEWSDVRWVS